MEFGLANTLMLAGLAGVSIPLVIHLLNRRRYQIVHWGGMQFLEVTDSTRRRLQLEQLLLLLVRMLLIAALVLALAQPFMRGLPWVSLRSAANRDVVLVIDGSASMTYAGGRETPLAAAQYSAHQIISSLQPGDSVAIIYATEVPQVVLAPPTFDLAKAQQAVDGLARPRGGCDLVRALDRAATLASQGVHTRREIVVLTDNQAGSWCPDQPGRWDFVLARLTELPHRPRLWVVPVGPGPDQPHANWALDCIAGPKTTACARRCTFRSVLLDASLQRRSGSDAQLPDIKRRITWLVDGKQVRTRQVGLAGGSRRPLVLKRRFTKPGMHIVSVVLQEDAVEADNRAEFVVEVTEALPALLVDGDQSLEPWASETDFLRPALMPSEQKSPAVRVTVVPIEKMTPEQIRGQRVVVLANVQRVSAELHGALARHVAAGAGLLVAPGDRVDPDDYNRRLYRDGAGWLPCRLQRRKKLADEGDEGFALSPSSFFHPALELFREAGPGDLAQARFTNYWKLHPHEGSPPAVMIGAFADGAPWAVERAFEKGHVICLGAPLDADWSNLPARADFVPLVHRLVYYLAGASLPPRNVGPGDPLLLVLPTDFKLESVDLEKPDGQVVQVPVKPGRDRKEALFTETLMPGMYHFHRVGPVGQPFVVDFDRAESRMEFATPEQMNALTGHVGLRWAQDMDALEADMFRADDRQEIWRWVVVLGLALLVSELWMARRMAGSSVSDFAEELRRA